MCPPGFDVLHIPRITGRGGGVALVFRTCFKASLQPSVQYNSIEYMEVLLTCNSDTYRIFVIYRPPSSSKNNVKFSDFIEEFNNMLEKSILSSGKLLIVGDFNIHCDVTLNADTLKFRDLSKEYVLIQHISESTHKCGHTLDLVITRNQSDVNNLNIADPLLSDHSMISFSFHFSAPKIHTLSEM